MKGSPNKHCGVREGEGELEKKFKNEQAMGEVYLALKSKSIKSKYFTIPPSSPIKCFALFSF